MKASPEEIAQRFDRLVEYLSDLERGQTAIMDAALALDLTAAAAAASTPQARHLLDIGCGAGNYALKLLQRLPDLDVTLVDLGEALLARAVKRVSSVTSGRVTPVRGDIRQVDFGQERFDIVLAGAVLHHLRQESEWEAVFARIHAALTPGGSIWISDLVEHVTPDLQSLMMSRYADYLIKLGGEKLRDAVFAEIAAQDTPRPLTFQLDLLRKVGFGRVEILHKNGCFATFGALKT